MKIPLTQTELDILCQVDACGGTLALNLSDPLHCQYYMNSLGGEALLRSKAPKLYQTVQARMLCGNDCINTLKPQFLGESAPLQLEDYATISHTRIDTYQTALNHTNLFGADGTYHVIRSTFEASYASCPVAALHIRVKVVDIQMQECIQDNTYVLTPDANHIFTQEFSVPIEVNCMERERSYRTIVTVSDLAPTLEGCSIPTPKVVSSLAYSPATSDDIEAVTLVDPQPINAGSRSHHKDEICVSYMRDGNLGHPDYSYKVNMSSSVTQMPVHLNFTLTVELRNGACFRLDQEGSYLCGQRMPDIHLSRFDDAELHPVSEGRAHLYQNWKAFTAEHISVEKTDDQKRATKLKLTFPNHWDSNLEWTKVKNISTYADFYAMLSFNTYNKTSSGAYADQTTSVFVRYEQDPGRRYNPTLPGVNTIHVPRMFYQWGCFGKDTVFRGAKGPVRACDVRLHDMLMAQDGRLVEVEDIYSGNEDTILHIVHEKGDIFLTPDHTLFGECMTPLAAENVIPGCRLLRMDPETFSLNPVTVSHIETLPYHDKVYNFKFSRPQYLIANDLVAGDYAWQQKIRPSNKILSQVPANQALCDILSELNSLSISRVECNDAPLISSADFVMSDRPECLSLHYFAVKTLGLYNDLYTDAQAQTIAEYCQYIGDNASIGGLAVKNVPEDINEAGLATLVISKGSPYYLVPVIPTAMVNWYNSEELANPRKWNSSSCFLYHRSKPVEYCYHAAQDILAPFHYPFCTAENPDGTEYLSPAIQQLMKKVEQHAASQKTPDRDTLAAMGIVLHMFLDSLLHEGFYPTADWRNLGRIEQIIDPSGTDITDQHKPYNPEGAPFPFGEYSPDTIYPTGIQENGDASQCSYARYCYRFPTDTGELPLDAFSYGGYRNYANAARYTYGCKRVLQFLTACRGLSYTQADENNWNLILAPAIEKTLNQYASSQSSLRKLWETEFPSYSYHYDAAALFERLMEGDSSCQDDAARYAEFFSFTLLTDRIRKGKDPV